MKERNQIRRSRNKDQAKIDLKQTTTLNEDVADNYCLYIFLVCFIGFMNNAGFMMVVALAHDIAADFDKSNLMPLFQFFEDLLSPVIWYANSVYFIKIKHIYRLAFNAIIMVLSFVMMSVLRIYVFSLGFYLALFCAVLYGITQSFGESTTLGLLKGYPIRLVGLFSTGTGMAGFFGACIFLITKPFINSGYVFMIMVPFSILYFVNCIILVNKRRKHPFVDETTVEETSVEYEFELSPMFSKTNPDLLSPLLSKTDSAKIEQQLDIGDDSHQNIPLNFENSKLIMSKCGSLIINLALNYFFLFCCTTGFADIYSTKLKHKAQADPDMDENSAFVQTGYIILICLYQFGAFLSRSSLSIVKVNRVHILTIIQFFNFMFGFVNSYWMVFTNNYVMNIWMLCAGLAQGSSYANIMYLIINSDKLKKSEKELAVMIAGTLMNAAIVVAALFSLTLSNTIFKNA